jgi:AraC family transcriptional regulator of adaptative response / DNA-3-methyladenine glycosylase II
LRRDAARPAPSASAITLTLGYAAPYDWNAMIDFLAARAIPGVETVEPHAYRRTIDLAGCLGWIAIQPVRGKNALSVTIDLAELRALPAIIARVRKLCDLASDVAAIGAQLAEDPRLAPLVAARPGLRVPGAWDPFELAVRAILGQQITVAGARRLAALLVATHGEKLPSAPEGLTHAFPRPERLATADLSELGMPRARIASITALATAAAEGPRLFDAGGDLAAKVERLCALPGIGEWTAHYVAMRALREPDAFPAADVGLLRAMAGRGVRPSPAALLAHAERWRPWRAYAAQHLWSADPALLGKEPDARVGLRAASRRRAKLIGSEEAVA